jgi:hypothetical protein
MNKFFLRVIVASITFALSVCISTVWKWVRGPEPVSLVVELGLRVPPGINYPLTADEQTILDVYREYGPAQTRHDRAFFEKVETDNFILSRGNQNLSREEDIREMENEPMDIEYDIDVEYLTVLGNSAAARGRIKAKFPYGSTMSQSFLDVWVRRGNEWLIQSTSSP